MKDINQTKKEYSNWLNRALLKASKKKLVGIMICLYENDFIQAQLLGYSAIDRKDGDWVCNWSYEDEVIYDFDSNSFPKDWEEALDESKSWTLEFIERSDDASGLLREIGLLAFGFSDGDIEMLYPERERGTYV